MRINQLVLLAIGLCLSVAMQAQNFSITGTLKDKDSKQTLEAATVFLETVKDSTLITYTITNQDGFFQLEGRAQENNARVNISFLGYENFTKNVDLSTGDITLGDIEVAPSTNTLGEVVVKSRAPVTVKKDTLEFNVSSFKTKKDANIEDLLKELPGVEVDESGKILVNGKEVNKILVNGKPFFGDDPTIATRNLTKEIVEKIQVVDTKTDDEAFAGEDGDQESKTINLTISEEKNKGVFGRVAAGGGTDNRFEYAGIVNAFDNERRISVLAGGNNINSAGFSFGEIRKMFGGGRSVYFNGNGSFGIDGRSFGGGQGIVNSRSVGANYTDEYAKGFDANMDYFYSAANSFDETRVERENILPDRRFFTNSDSRNDSNSDNHSINTTINIKKDSTLLINIKPKFSFANSETRFRRTEESLNEDGERINESATNNFVTDEGKNFENTLSVTKKWGDKGAYVRARVQNEINRQESEDFIVSNTEIFGDNPSVINRNQFTDGETKLDGYNLNLTYRVPLVAKKLFLDVDFGHRSDTRKRKRSTFDFDEVAQQYSILNQELSTDFEGRNSRTTPKLGLNLDGEKLNVNVSAGYVFRTLENNDNLRPELDIKQNFEALELDTYVNYRFSPKASMYASLGKSNRPPEVTQLNPFVDVSDPLNIVEGNPNLAPANDYNFYGGFNNYDFQKGGGWYVNGNGRFTNDAIVRKTSIDDNLVSRTTYVNVNGNYSVGAGGGYNKNVKIDSLRSIKYGGGIYTNFGRNVNFNNEVQYASKTRSLTPRVNFTYTWKNLFEVKPSYNISISKTQFGLDAFEDQDFISHNVSLGTALFVPKNWEWRNDINYNYNPNIASDFQRSAVFWNSTLAYSFAKERAIATLKVYDVLDQNTNARRTANANFIQDVQSTVLEQYFMLSLSWKFNTLGKKGETNDGGVFFF